VGKAHRKATSEAGAPTDSGAGGGADSKAPPWIKWVTRLALLAGLIGLVATIYLVGPTTIWGHLRAIGWWFAALIAVDIAMTCLDAAAVHSLTTGQGAPPYSRVVIAQLAGRAVNAVTPGGNLGEALKASLLAEQTKGSRVVAAVMYVGLTSLVLSLVMIAIGAPLSAFLLDLHDGVRIALFVAGALAAGAAVAVYILVRRGMLKSIVGLAGRLRLVSKARRQKWKTKLTEVDDRLSGASDPRGRKRATVFVLLSKSLGWFATWLTVATAGYILDAPELLGILSAGIVLGWVSMLIPMGLGIAEGGNYGLFGLIGAPAALGVSLALAHRVMQILSAIVGFSVLGIYRLTQRGTQLRAKSRARRKPAPPPSVVRAGPSDLG
jgi:uncharacterized protein (TIRG00374 family)